MEKLVFSILVFLISNSGIRAQEPSDTEKLYYVINTFKAAFINSTMEQDFYDLFLYDSITWASVYEGKTKEILKTRDDYQPAFSGSFKDFYEWIKKEDTYKENFYNIITNKDNNQATVSFDYTFKKGNEIQNWGKEYWTLLKVEDEWKIVSVVWTMNYQDIEKCPFTNSSYYRE